VYEVGKRHWRSVAVQIVSEPENCQGAGILSRAAARVRVPSLVVVLVSGSESCKKHDKQLTFIVRVIVSAILFVKVVVSLIILLTVRVFEFASSFKSFGSTSAGAAFKCACKSLNYLNFNV